MGRSVYLDTSSFCAATGGAHFVAADPDTYGELFCADFVDGSYVQRAPTAEEAALFASS